MDGIIIINKEKNWTSNDIVQKLKGILHEKVGHTGTLDPQATGVLPILVGKGTGLSKYLINHDKEYIATIKLGQKTSTGDAEGDVIETKNVTKEMLEENFVKCTVQSFLGKSLQVPPMYSAIKVNGKKLYEYARNGKKIDVEPRNIEIYGAELISIQEEAKEIVYKVKCSKGTYIRVLCEDIAKKLGTVGFMKDLNRTKVGDFFIEDAIKISDVINCKNIDDLKFISIEDFFLDKVTLKFDDDKLKRFLNGVKVCVKLDDGIYRVYDEGNKFVGIGVVKDCRIKRDLIIF